ncbi:MAG: DUF92 domain-containing protein [Salinibacter sp.]
MLPLRLLAGDGLMALGALVGLGVLVGLGEGLRVWGVPVRTTRRLVHAGVSLFVASTPLLFTRPLPVYALAGLFVIFNAGARLNHWWPGIHAARPKSWGTVALPLSVVPALAATWSVTPERILALEAAYLVLGLADPAASWVGEGTTPEARNRPSTLRGSLTFGGLALVLTTLLLATATPWSPLRVLGTALGTTVVTTLVESISSRGWDNLFVVVAVILVLVPLQTGGLTGAEFGAALLVGAVFAGGAYGAGALDGRGAATGGLFAASLVGLGGEAWIGPGLVFFGLSSALTGLRRDGREESVRRTQAQVLANGGVAWTALAVVALTPAGTPDLRLWGYAAFIGALAAAAADTWATELGSWSPVPPWSLREQRRVPTGTSGAVSLVGTGAAFLGALSVVGTALLVGGSLSGHPTQEVLLLCGAGVLGMGADGVVGAFLQAQYRTPASGRQVERPPSTEAELVRGSAAIGNNVVNLVGTTVGALAALASVFLLG